jgi:hypothetical protein
MSESTLWKKGQSGNPKGRPKGLFNWQRAIVQKADELHPSDSQGRSWGQRVVDNLFRMAADGRPSSRQLKAIEELLNRGLGKPVQAIAVADLRPEAKEQLIENLLGVLQAEKAEKEKADGDKLPLQ